MKIEYSSRYLKDFSSIREKRAKSDTEKVERLINMSDNFIELHKILDIKKYDVGLGGYRIRYSGNPEYRIRFELLDDKDNPKEKVVKLQIVLPREKYEKYAHRSINESINDRIKIIINERQLNLLKNLKGVID